MGYLDGAVDGIYGGDTASAVKAFQSDEGLSVTGMVNGDTLSRITSEYAAQSGETVLSPGDSGKKVIRLQNKLLLHGYNPGSVDGIYGEGTAEAVRQLQAEENLALPTVMYGTDWTAHPALQETIKKYSAWKLLPTRLMTEMEEG